MIHMGILNDIVDRDNLRKHILVVLGCTGNYLWKWILILISDFNESLSLVQLMVLIIDCVIVYILVEFIF